MELEHDELIKKIQSFTCCSGAAEVALLKVVELHKPMEFQFNDQPVLVCGHCQLGVVGDEYPCETIQAIEKELG